MLFSGNKTAILFYLFFQAAHKCFSAQRNTQLMSKSFYVLRYRMAEHPGCKVHPPPNLRARDRRAELYKKADKSVRPHSGWCTAHRIPIYKVLKIFWDVGSKPRKQVLCSIMCSGISYSRSKCVADLLFTAKRDKLGVGGGEVSFCFYLEAINEQEPSWGKTIVKSQALCVVQEKHAEVNSSQEERAGFPNADFVRQIKSLVFFVVFSPR